MPWTVAVANEFRMPPIQTCEIMSSVKTRIDPCIKICNLSKYLYIFLIFRHIIRYMYTNKNQHTMEKLPYIYKNKHVGVYIYITLYVVKNHELAI